MTEKFTSYVLGKIGEKVKQVLGETFHVPNTPWTSTRKYAKVRSTYKLGCDTCTEMGHSECSSSKKRDTCSGSEEPNGKTNNQSKKNPP